MVEQPSNQVSVFFFQQWAGAPSLISTDFRPGQPCLTREGAVTTEMNCQETLWKEGEIST